MKASRRNNIIAGAFVVGSVLVGVWGSFQLTKEGPDGPTKDVVFRFSLAQGAPGIKKGSPVLLGGQDVGSVVNVGFLGDSGATPRGVDVLAKVREDVPLYQDATVFLERPLLGSLSSIGITAVGTSPADRAASPTPPPAPTVPPPSKLAPDAMVLLGGIAPPAALQQAGFGPEQAKKIEQIINDVSGAASRVSSFVEKNEPKIDALVSSAQDTITGVQKSVPDWSKRVDSVLARADKASEGFEPAVEDVRGVIRRVDNLVERNEPRVDSILTGADRVVARFDSETMAKFESAIAQAETVFKKLDASAVRINDFLAADIPGMRNTLANLRLASDQIKLTTIDLREQPWRILYEPSTKELENQAFYDAARTYATAVSDLRAASEALQSTLAAPGATNADLANVHQMTEDLAQAFQKYRDAERGLLKRMTETETQTQKK